MFNVKPLGKLPVTENELGVLLPVMVYPPKTDPSTADAVRVAFVAFDAGVGAALMVTVLPKVATQAAVLRTYIL